MPRNAQGLYTLPAGNPVISGTIIESEWANRTMDDLAAAITGSLPRDGSAPMTGPLTLSADPITASRQAVTKEYVDRFMAYSSGMPIGAISAFGGTLPPGGWLRCDGSAVSRTTYDELFALIGTTYGAGDGSTTFNVPDLRNEFIRGRPDWRNIGSKAPGSFESHLHMLFDPGHNHKQLSHDHTAVTQTHGHGTSDTGHAHGYSKFTSGTQVYFVGEGGNWVGNDTDVTTTVNSGVTVNIADPIEAYARPTTAVNQADITGITMGATGGSETAPQNIALDYYIKAALDGAGSAGSLYTELGYISVKEFGATGDGVTDDSPAFRAAVATGAGIIVVPPGTYNLGSDVYAPDSFFQLVYANIIGYGRLRTEQYTSTSSDGLYVNDLDGYVSDSGFTTSVKKMATVPVQHFPRKFVPTYAFIDLLSLSPKVCRFESADGNTQDLMNEQFFRESLRDMFASGVSDLIISYVEYFGFWFFQPTFPYPYDYDTSRVGDWWKTWLPEFPGVIGFDPIRVCYEEAAKAGGKVYAGLGRNGDTPLMNDLFTVYTLGQPDPMRYGLTIQDRTTNAIDRTCQVANDLNLLYGMFASFGGFFITHEPSQLSSANYYLSYVTNVGSAIYASLNSYGLPVLLAPAILADLDDTELFANTLLASGVSAVLPQDAVGPGYSEYTYTYCPQVSIAKVGEYLKRWRDALSIVNGKAFSQNRNVSLVVTQEIWQMGFTPNASLTISALTGTGVTATASAGVFSATDVGKFIGGGTGGSGTITGFTSATEVTMDVTTDFVDLTFAHEYWSINEGYQKSYPTDYSRVQQQFFQEAPWVSATAINNWFGMLDSGTNSLKLSQLNSGLTDFRTRAVNLYDNLLSAYKAQLKKYYYTPICTILQRKYFTNDTFVSAPDTTTVDLGVLYGLSAASFTRYNCIVRASTDVIATPTVLTISLLLNGVSVRDVLVSQGGNEQISGTYSLVYEFPGMGLKTDVSVRLSYPGGTVMFFGATLDIDEYVQ